MFGIGGFELFLILLFGFLIFGPDKLPEIAKTAGKAIAKFRGAQEDMTEQLKTATFMDKESDQPFKNPLEVVESAAAEAKRKTKDARDAVDAATDKAVEGASAAGEAMGAAASARVESFAERKARYDRERAARKKAEAEKAAATESDVDPKTDVSEKKVSDAGADDAPGEAEGEGR